MSQVIENRQSGNAWVSLPETPKVDGYIAVQNCGDLGDIWWVQNPVDGTWERFWVVDCAKESDGALDWMQENDIALEVDYETAVRWNTVGRGIKIRWSKVDPRGFLQPMP